MLWKIYVPTLGKNEKGHLYKVFIINYIPIINFEIARIKNVEKSTFNFFFTYKSN